MYSGKKISLISRLLILFNALFMGYLDSKAQSLLFEPQCQLATPIVRVINGKLNNCNGGGSVTLSAPDGFTVYRWYKNPLQSLELEPVYATTKTITLSGESDHGFYKVQVGYGDCLSGGSAATYVNYTSKAASMSYSNGVFTANVTTTGGICFGNATKLFWYKNGNLVKEAYLSLDNTLEESGSGTYYFRAACAYGDYEPSENMQYNCVARADCGGFGFSRPTIPLVPDVSGPEVVCLGTPATLIATCELCSGGSGLPFPISCQVKWYANSTDTNPIHTGDEFSPVETTPGYKTYYAEANANGYSSGKVAFSFEVIANPTTAFTLTPTQAIAGHPQTANIISPVSGALYIFNWGNGVITSSTTGTSTYIYPDEGNFNVTVSAWSKACSSGSTVNPNPVEINKLCTSSIPDVPSGVFKVDKLTGNIIFVRPDCPVQAVFSCVSDSDLQTLGQVVSASAVTFSDTWLYENHVDNSGVPFNTNANAFERGERGKWRIKSTYLHNTSLIKENKNYAAGTFALQNFNWSNEALNNKAKWLLGTEVTSYSPHGDALSERDILGVESSAKFGYFNAVPYLTAKNAGYTTVLFESFENLYDNNSHLEDKMLKPENGIIDNILSNDFNYAHSGYQSLRLPNGGSFDVSEFTLSQAQAGKGLLVKMWVRLSNTNSFVTLQDNLQSRILRVNVKNQSLLIPFSVVARTGDWILCEAYLKNFGTIQSTNTVSLTISYTQNEPIWIDDIRVQPIDAEMNCYVYDKNNLRLLAVFDDQHFGLYYQYNREGQLIRKLLETEQGVKTVQETHYNTKLVPN